MKPALKRSLFIAFPFLALAVAAWQLNLFSMAASLIYAGAAKNAAQLALGSALYQARCAMCHDGGVNGAPSVETINLLDKEKIIASMTTGVMQPQSAGLSTEDIEAVAAYLAQRQEARGVSTAVENRCEGALALEAPALWSRWGNNLRNTRFQDADRAGISAATAPSLKLKWAFGFDGAVRARAHPTVTPDAIFTADQNGTVYALDTQTGCVWWTFAAESEVRSALTLERGEDGGARLYFGDFNANVYAIDAESGGMIWKTPVKDHPVGTITGSVTVYNGRVYTPLSSTEIINTIDDSYECCTFRGGVAALDAATGEKLWRNYTTPPPEKTGLNAIGAQMWGPSGAPIWSTPTVDEKRGLLYVGTGQNYSSPATGLSSAILAFDLASGDLVWAQQTVEQDAWNGACVMDRINCPEEDGPDFDFGAPPILHTLPSGRDIILAGQKSGMIYAMDPDDNGAILWEQRVGMGGFNGGVHWGMSVVDERLFVGVSDGPGHEKPVGPPRPGMHAYVAETGEPIWSVIEPLTCKRISYACFPGLSAAITATPEVIFAGGLNGHLHAYAAADGEKLWQYDTMKDFETVNGVQANGGSIDSDGPVVANGLVIVNSGYDKFREIPGNVLLVFEAEPAP